MQYLKNGWITLLGIMIGAIGGYLYWRLIGCNSSTCYIQSNPFRMTAYGAVIGGLIANIIQPKAKESRDKEN